MSTKMSVNYGNEVYWEERYKKSPGQQFDWLNSYSQLKQILEAYIPSKESRILYIGCGTSNLGDHLFESGYTNITCADISKQAIKQQKQRAKKRNREAGMFKVLDVTKMQEQNESFDVVIDKSMLDSILCSEDYLRKVLRALRQISRVLTPEGIYLMFSYQSPGKRIYYLKNRLTKFKKVEYFPISKFKPGSQQSARNINESKDDIRSVNSKVSKFGFEKRKRNHYCYVCTRQEQDVDISRQSLKVLEEEKEEQDQIENEDENQSEDQIQKIEQKNQDEQQEHDNEQENPLSQQSEQQGEVQEGEEKDEEGQSSKEDHQKGEEQAGEEEECGDQENEYGQQFENQQQTE